MRSADLVFAFPPIILAMVVAAVLGRGLQNAALAIVIVAWPSYARVVRGLVLTVGDTEYVQSARLLGARARRALFRDVLPNVAGPVLVLRRSTSRPRSCCSRASRSSASARSRRRRSGGRWSPTGRSTSSGGGWARSPASRSSRSCSRSTSSATACATSSTRAPRWRAQDEAMSLLEVEGLRVRLPTPRGAGHRRRRRRLPRSSRARCSASPARAAAARRCRCSRCSALLPGRRGRRGQRALRRPRPARAPAPRSCASSRGASSRWSSRIR